MRLAVSAAALSTALLAAGPAPAAEPWGIPGEKPMVLKGRVVDAICHLTGQCPRDCGAGRRQLGIAVAGGPFRLVAKGAVDFAGAVPDLIGYCGREIEADGLLIETPEIVLFFVQGVRSDASGPFTPADRFKAEWEARHGKAEEWWRADPEANRILAEDGPYGIRSLAPKPKP